MGSEQLLLEIVLLEQEAIQERAEAARIRAATADAAPDRNRRHRQRPLTLARRALAKVAERGALARVENAPPAKR
jgi:hypothetical protein